MIPTLIGLIVALIGLALLVTATVPAMLAFVIACSLMSGSAAILLPALGGSSIPPVQVALGFLVLRLLLPGAGQAGKLTEAIRANAMLLAFVIYGIAGAFALPRLFAGQVQLVPLRSTGLRFLLQQFPLAPSSQNVTTSVYLTGTFLFATTAYMAGMIPQTARTYVKASVWVAWTHMALGIGGVVAAGTGFNAFFQFFRNGSYAQLSHGYDGVARMAGITPEASSFATFGFASLVLLTECWLRGVLPRRTGPAALAMIFVLLASTSSTAYVSLAVYVALLAARVVVAPQRVLHRQAMWIGATALFVLLAVSALLLLAPGFLQKFADMLAHFTVDKPQSTSAIQRGFWAKQGLDAFTASYGLGVGAGSFRSSSLFTAIAGSLGVIGIVTFLGYLWHVFKPLRQSSYGIGADERTSVGIAASWAAVMILVPLGIGAASPDPGYNFALFSGLALALRRAPRRDAPSPPAPVVRTGTALKRSWA